MIVNRPEFAHYQIDPERYDLIAEFKRRPFGPHSAELAKVIHRFRWSAPNGRWILVAHEPGKSWMLARNPGKRGQPIETFPSMIFTDLAAAEWQVFKMRWECVTGQAIDESRLTDD